MKCRPIFSQNTIYYLGSSNKCRNRSLPHFSLSRSISTYTLIFQALTRALNIIHSIQGLLFWPFFQKLSKLILKALLSQMARQHKSNDPTFSVPVFVSVTFLSFLRQYTWHPKWSKENLAYSSACKAGHCGYGQLFIVAASNKNKTHTQGNMPPSFPYTVC